jgi:signal transduction histidine kinase
MTSPALQSVVARLSARVPLLAKGLLNTALARRGLCAGTASAFQLKQTLDDDLVGRLKRLVGDAASGARRPMASLELHADGRLRRADPTLRLFFTGLELRDPERLRDELVARGVLLPLHNGATDASFPAAGTLALRRRTATGELPSAGRRQASVGLLDLGGRTLRVTRAPLGPQGEAGLLVVVEDITVERAVEAEVEQMLRRLEEAHDELRRSQAEVIRTETLASLGGLVAGVAHEINTPVGIGVTAATMLVSQVEALKADLAGGKLKKSSLDRFVEDADEAARLILTNLTRAGELVRSFKQVSVDRSAQDVRTLELGAYIHDVVASLRPQLKQVPVKIEIEVPEPLHIEANAGAIAQVLTNLIMNSLLHAFPGGRAGEIRIRADPTGDWAQILFGDDGVGMSDEVKEKAFLPFFTTRRNSGGSGLGLSVVRNLVTKSLHGEIALESAPGAGSWFTIRFPSTPPGERDPGTAT